MRLENEPEVMFTNYASAFTFHVLRRTNTMSVSEREITTERAKDDRLRTNV